MSEINQILAVAVASSVYACSILFLANMMGQNQKQKQRRIIEREEEEADCFRLKERLSALVKQAEDDTYNKRNPTHSNQVEFARDSEARVDYRELRRTGFRVLVNHLPFGTSCQELMRNMHVGRGVCYTEVSQDARGLTTGIVHYQSSEDVNNAIREYDNSRFGKTPAVITVKEYYTNRDFECPCSMTHFSSSQSHSSSVSKSHDDKRSKDHRSHEREARKGRDGKNRCERGRDLDRRSRASDQGSDGERERERNRDRDRSRGSRSRHRSRSSEHTGYYDRYMHYVRH